MWKRDNETMEITDDMQTQILRNPDIMSQGNSLNSTMTKLLVIIYRWNIKTVQQEQKILISQAIFFKFFIYRL